MLSELVVELSFFLKSTRAPPMPVAAPAISVISNAPQTPFMYYSSFFALSAAYTIYIIIAV